MVKHCHNHKQDLEAHRRHIPLHGRRAALVLRYRNASDVRADRQGVGLTSLKEINPIFLQRVCFITDTLVKI